MDSTIDTNNQTKRLSRAWSLVLLFCMFCCFGTLHAENIVEPEIPSLEAQPTSRQLNIFQEKVAALTKNDSSRVGFYIEDIETGAVETHMANKRYYLASVIKLFVMIEIYRLIDKKKLRWSDRIRITRSKYRDGAGKVNWLKVGKKVTIKRLVELMMRYSDNAATDILIEIAGLHNIENTMYALGLVDLGPLTSILDVRKLVFSELHPLAGNLTSMDYIELWKVRNFSEKLRIFANLIDKPKATFSTRSLQRAYGRFYTNGYNSLALSSLALLLKKLVAGEVLSRKRSAEMLALMKRCTTGKDRIKAGLPAGWSFAHKTGTQYKRMCDVGVAFGPNDEPVVINMCVEKFTSRKQAGALMASITRLYFENRS